MLCLDDAFGVKPPKNGRILRNLVQGANFLQSHILHFYHLAALDYVKGPETAPFIPRYGHDFRLPKAINDAAVQHYIQALHMRKKAHELCAIFGAKAPHTTAFVPGGITEQVTQEKIEQFAALLDEIMDFVDNVYIPDVLAVADAYSDWFEIGKGCRNMLAWGVFPLDDSGDPSGMNQLIKRGRYTDEEWAVADPSDVTEHVMFSKYEIESTQKHPSEGETKPEPHKPNAYSWLKAPRLKNKPHEVGPLARMWVNKVPEVVKLGDKAFSVLGRHFARAIETSMVGHAMRDWLEELEVGAPTFNRFDIPEKATGMGLTEAPRGALGHWIEVKDYRIANYQCVVPTTWNACPRDDNGVRGPMEEAFIGAPVEDPEQPVELVRIVRSMDPCIGCAVHLLEIKGAKKKALSFKL